MAEKNGAGQWGVFDEYNRSENSAEADAKAIASDWMLVGQDILDAIEQSEAEHKAA